jgi:hypothetical protein
MKVKEKNTARISLFAPVLEMPDSSNSKLFAEFGSGTLTYRYESGSDLDN